MRRQLPGAVTLALAGLLLLSACGSVEPYAAKVDGKSISQDQLEEEMRAIAANEAYLKSVENRLQVRGTGAGTFDAAFTGQVLGRQIQYVLVDREIERRDIEITPAERNQARAEVAQQAGGEEILNGFPAEYQETLIERAAKVDALTVALAGQAASDEAARAYYDSHQAEFQEACVSHILVSSRERADQIKARLAAGEDFGAVARAESQDAQSAAQNGDLGCEISSDTFPVPEFTQAILSQPVGEVGNPVQTQFGFHLIRVTARTLPPYDQVSAQARDKVILASKTKLQEWITAAVGEAEIEVNPRYGTFNKQTLTVDPPPPPSTTAAPPSPPGSGIQPIRP